MSTRFFAVLLALIAAFTTGPAKAQGAETTLVFAAASLKNALDAAVDEYAATGGGPVTISYAASSALAKQIEEGAPADIFFSADLEWMDYLADRDLIQEDSRVGILGNDLVLIAPAGSTVSLEIGPGFPLLDALGGGKLAVAETASVPAGKYGKAALQSLGVWDSVFGSVAEAENVRAALALVSRGEAPLGIVYATDAKADTGVKVVGIFPDDSHPAILYPIALTTAANPEASHFLEFLVSEKAALIFERHGFRVRAPSS
jgi:molybdate transport system substrate-binding protein